MSELPTSQHMALMDPSPVKGEELDLRLKDRSSPIWAKSLTNTRGLVRFDTAQYMALVGV